MKASDVVFLVWECLYVRNIGAFLSGSQYDPTQEHRAG